MRTIEANLADDILGNVGWCYWSVNVPKSNKERDRAANVSMTASGIGLNTGELQNSAFTSCEN